MEIYLMQHGLAMLKDQDPEEGLSSDGKAVIHAGGKALKKMGVDFDAILSSPKKRSKQTAAIMARETGFPVEKIVETKRVKAMTPPEETLEALSELSAVRCVLVAGHLPSVAEVASFLLTQGSKVVVQFEMGGCCRIDVNELCAGAGCLRWFLLPNQLKLVAV